ncbi:MAG: FAD-dependent monooxygenase, partial [Acidobacteriota bacterium]
MLRISEIKLALNHAEDALEAAILAKLQISGDELKNFSIFKRSYDARRKSAIVFVYIVDVETAKDEKLLEKFTGDPHVIGTPDTTYKLVGHAPKDLKIRPIVIGTGPCGLFAGLMLAKMGFRPIILERGKSVRERSADTFGFWRHGTLNPESNAQFGEGGAGTFSDGKLYSQVKDGKNLGRKVLTEFVEAGANPEILFVNKPHIGTYKLIKIVENMRATIESLGGEIRFQSRVENLEIENNQVRGVTLASGEFIESSHVV